MLKWILSGVLLVLVMQMEAQVVYQYNFDTCGFSERNSLLNDLVVLGTPDCECGPENDSYAFNGTTDGLQMPIPGNLLQQDNYSFSFYMRPSDGGTMIQQVFSNAPSCGSTDSLFSVQYFPGINTVTCRLADFGATVGFVEAALDDQKCWNHVTLVKSGRILQLYINGERRAEFAGNQPINIFSNEDILVAQTNCGPGQNMSNYEGALDEITWYDVALTQSQVRQAYRPIDEIITSDTLIFSGDQFVPRAAKTCATNITWQPGNGISNASVLQPTIGPSETQSYEIRFSYGACVAYDSLTVVVVDEDDVDCENILLPTAFTPNGDNLNDVYGISNGFIIDRLIQFDVMDRQGNTLFSALDPREKWDGMYRGKVMSGGPYIYKLSYECKDETFTRTGKFNILR